MRSVHSRSGALLVAFLAAASTACTGSNVNPFTDAPAPPVGAGGSGSPDEILRSEIRSRGSNDHTAMSLIRRLRPAWLRARGQKSLQDDSSDYPVVYIDDIRHGSLSTLNRIPASEILSIRFYNTGDATTRWGTGHPSGVINVLTGRF